MSATAKRIYWAITALGTAPESSAAANVALASGSGGPYTERKSQHANFVPGVQSVGITTTFNLEQVFELGQLDLYQDVEEVPDIEVSVERIIDDHILMYTRCVDPVTPAGNKTISSIQNNKVDIFMSVHPDGSDHSGQTAPDAIVHCSGMYLSNVSYSFAVDGNFTESVTLVGNHKRWRTGVSGTVGKEWSDGSTDVFVAATHNIRGLPGATKGAAGTENIHGDKTHAFVKRRKNLLFELPSSCGYKGDLNADLRKNNSDADQVKVNSASVSCDFGREAINVLGQKLPYHRYVSYPVEVTCDIEVTVNDIRGQGVSALPETGNLSEELIRFVVVDELDAPIATFDLGDKNKLTSVSWGGADTGGGNATLSYSYRNFNRMDIQSHATTFSEYVQSDGATVYKIIDYHTTIPA